MHVLFTCFKKISARDSECNTDAFMEITTHIKLHRVLLCFHCI